MFSLKKLADFRGFLGDFDKNRHKNFTLKSWKKHKRKVYIR